MTQSTRNPPQPPQEVRLDLSQRLSDHQLSLAMAYLAMANPELPIPQELSHLTAPEWRVVNSVLEVTMEWRERLPLH